MFDGVAPTAPLWLPWVLDMLVPGMELADEETTALAGYLPEIITTFVLKGSVGCVSLSYSKSISFT
jgi:hypothetical protein